MKGKVKEYPNRFLFHALLTAVLLTGATGARAEDGQAPTAEPANAVTDAPPPPSNLNAVAAYIERWGAIHAEHDRQVEQENAEVMHALRQKYGNQQVPPEPPVPMLEGESPEAHQQRIMDASAAWQAEHGKPAYRTADGFVGFQIEGIAVTKEEYEADVARQHRQLINRRRDLDRFDRTTRFGLTEGEAGFESDEQIKAKEQHTDQREQEFLAEEKALKEQNKKLIPARSLISHEKQADSSP